MKNYILILLLVCSVSIASAQSDGNLIVENNTAVAANGYYLDLVNSVYDSNGFVTIAPGSSMTFQYTGGALSTSVDLVFQDPDGNFMYQGTPQETGNNESGNGDDYYIGFSGPTDGPYVPTQGYNDPNPPPPPMPFGWNVDLLSEGFVVVAALAVFIVGFFTFRKKAAKI